MNDLDPKSVASTKTTVIHERFPYRFVQRGYIQLNGKPDFRLQKQKSILRSILTFICLTMEIRCSLLLKTLSTLNG